jgi:hypothetical protein
MREKMKNTLKLTCNDVDLTTIRNIEFYVKQPNFFGCYVPFVSSASEMSVIIPLADAKRLTEGTVKLQFAFTYADGTPGASDVVTAEVGELLKGAGYDPV